MGHSVCPYLEYWKGVHSPEYPTVSLFNLEDDPQETNNLASTHPDLGIVIDFLRFYNHMTHPVSNDEITLKSSQVFANATRMPSLTLYGCFYFE